MQKASYPNLELLEYKSLLKLKKVYDVCHIKSIRTQMFSQVWGSTVLGFDKDEKGEPLFGGQMMTESYTTVFEITVDIRIKEKQMVEKISATEKEPMLVEMEVTKTKEQQFFVVAFGNEPCYMVENPTNTFFCDLEKHQMKSFTKSKEVY